MRRGVNADEIAWFYNATGEAIWHLQYVEEALCKFYIMYCIHFDADGINRNNAEDKLKKTHKKTLGQLIRLLESTNLIDQSMLAEFKEFNLLRKWVVHNSMRENGEDLYTDQGREVFAQKISTFSDMARSIHKNISNNLMHLATTAGYTTEAEIMKIAKLEINRLKGNA